MPETDSFQLVKLVAFRQKLGSVCINGNTNEIERTLRMNDECNMIFSTSGTDRPRGASFSAASVGMGGLSLLGVHVVVPCPLGQLGLVVPTGTLEIKNVQHPSGVE